MQYPPVFSAVTARIVAAQPGVLQARRSVMCSQRYAGRGACCDDTGSCCDLSADGASSRGCAGSPCGSAWRGAARATGRRRFAWAPHGTGQTRCRSARRCPTCLRRAGRRGEGVTRARGRPERPIHGSRNRDHPFGRPWLAPSRRPTSHRHDQRGPRARRRCRRPSQRSRRRRAAGR